MGKTLSTPDVNTNSEQEHDRTRSHDSPSQGSDSLLTDNVINGIESHLSTMQGSVRKMRGKNLREAEKKLMNAISDTEKKLTDLKQQLQLEEENAFDFCKLKAESMLVKTERAMSLVFEDYTFIPEPKSSFIKYHETSPDIKLHVGRRKELKSEDAQQSLELPEKMSEAIENKIKALRRETAEIMVPVVQKAYLETLKTEELVPALMPFIRKCIFLCWMMVVQSPPMCIHEVEMREHLKFDKNYFKEYTASGPMVKYFVWPALLLHENGPVVCKGIAQGC